MVINTAAMSSRNKRGGKSKQAKRKDDCLDANDEPIMDTEEVVTKERSTHTTPIGIQQTSIINHPPATTPQTPTPAPMTTPTTTQVNVELQSTVPLLTNTNQSVIGAVASFILVGEQTGDFSSISEEKEKNNSTNHIHVLFRL